MKFAVVAFLIAMTCVSKAGPLTDIGTLPGGGFSGGLDITADGLTVVGFSQGPTARHAFVWTSAGMTDIGALPGSTYSDAYGVSADGLVVVGMSDSINGLRAFRWTAAGGMTDLGVLNVGERSLARAASGDGSVVVGISNSSTHIGGAFRWTSAGMVDIGKLPGHIYSQAWDVSRDGNVIVGESNGTINGRAFRWTSAGMVDLGTLTGGTNSYARGVSADGAVVVGVSNEANGPGRYRTRAFRWTSAGMTSLGVLPGGNNSSAYATSADGSVVVGSSHSRNGGRAFRWTSAGMIDLGTLPGGNYSEAWGVSDDGRIVTGMSRSSDGDRAFIYTHRGMLDVNDWLGSVGGIRSTLSTSLELSHLHIEGAHHRPLAELGRGKSYWATGDVAGSSRSRDLITRSGEAGATFEPWVNVLVGIGAGYGRQDQQLLNNGSATTYGLYLVGELDFIVADGGILSMLVSSGDWQNETDRGYVTGTGVDYSHGETDIKSTAFRLRYDTRILAKALGADIKGYGSYGQRRARADGYVETGGSYAGSFSEMQHTAKEGRLGLAATRAFGEKFRGRLSAEWIRRFDREQASITARDIISAQVLTLPGASVQRDQARFGFDLDYLMNAKTTLSFTVHAAGRGEVADVSGAVSLRKAF